MDKKKKQFVYVLKTVPRLNDDINWTQSDNEIADRHFAGLRLLLKEGRLILAGRTLNEGKKRFGIVVFEAESEDEAQDIMSNDPAVKEGIMTAELFPYGVALIRK